MTSPTSSGRQVNPLQRRTDSKLDHSDSETESESRPEKRPRISDSAASTTTTALLPALPLPSGPDTSAHYNSNANSSKSKQATEQVAVSTATTESGSLFGGRMYLFRRGRGHSLRFHTVADPGGAAAGTDDALRNAASWSYEEETNSSGAEEEDIYFRHSRLKPGRLYYK